MSRIRRGWRETEVSIEADRLIVLCVNGERTHSDHVGHMKRASERVQQQPGADSAALHLGVNGKSREHKQRNRMTRHSLHDAFRGVGMPDLAGYNSVETNNFAAADCNVCLRGVRLLCLQRMTYQKTIKLWLPAGESLDYVGPV